MEHFSDPDGIIDGKTDGLTFDIFDDNTNLDDDFYGDYITLSDRGVASYNPAFVNSLGNEVSEWSLVGLMFEARDAYDSVAYSVPLNVVVVEISFTVIRDGSGPIGPDSPAYFSGQGLPNSLVEARFDSLKGIRINQTRVNADATWSMEISSSQLSGMEGTSEIIFEMDDQVYVAPGDNSDTLFQLSVGGDSESGLNLGLIAAIVVGIIILLGAGMFFFQVEYEDLDEDDELSEQQVAAVDPYAWAKARKEPVAIPTPAAAATPQAAAQALGATATQAVTPQASQHPGWLWDAESNNWVPDPNYKPGQ